MKQTLGAFQLLVKKITVRTVTTASREEGDADLFPPLDVIRNRGSRSHSAASLGNFLSYS